MEPREVMGPRLWTRISCRRYDLALESIVSTIIITSSEVRDAIAIVGHICSTPITSLTQYRHCKVTKKVTVGAMSISMEQAVHNSKYKRGSCETYSTYCTVLPLASSIIFPFAHRFCVYIHPSIRLLLNEHTYHEVSDARLLHNYSNC